MNWNDQLKEKKSEKQSKQKKQVKPLGNIKGYFTQKWNSVIIYSNLYEFLSSVEH